MTLSRHDLTQHGLDFAEQPGEADTVLVRFDWPELEALIVSDPAADFEFRLELTAGTRFSDYRIVGPAYRRHQILIPLDEACAGGAVVRVGFEPVRWDEDRPLPAYTLAASFQAKRRLIEDLERRMIWIFGSARSGTTWLLHDILGAAPSAARPDDLTGMRPIDEAGIGFLLGAVELDAERFYGVDRSVDTASADVPVFERMIARRSGQPEFVRNPRTEASLRRAIRELVFEHVLVHWGLLDYDFVGFKAPNEGHAADILMGAFPLARMIVIVRDGRDVMRSRFSPFASRTLAETTDLALRRYAVTYYAHYWNFQREVIERAFAAHDPERRLQVSYERLRAEELETFASLYRFIGAPLSEPEIAAVIDRVRLENVGRDQRGANLPRQTGEVGGYRRSFLKTEVALMTSIMEAGLRQHGYAIAPDEGMEMIDRLAVPGTLRSFGGLDGRVPEGIVLWFAAGVYDDLWTKPDAELEFAVPVRAGALVVDVLLPEDPEPEGATRPVQLTAGAVSQRIVLPRGGDASLRFPIDAPAHAPIRLTIHVGGSFNPAASGDERELGLYLVKLEVEPA
jgi:hypothetical protein